MGQAMSSTAYPIAWQSPPSDDCMRLVLPRNGLYLLSMERSPPALISWAQQRGHPCLHSILRFTSIMSLPCRSAGIGGVTMGMAGSLASKSLTLEIPRTKAVIPTLREGKWSCGHCQHLAPLACSAVPGLSAASAVCAHMKLQAHCKIRLGSAASWPCCSEAG